MAPLEANLPKNEHACLVCGRGAVTHVTARFDIFRLADSKVKIIGMWLCQECDKKLTQVLTRDGEEQRRLAHRLTENPDYMSKRRNFTNLRNDQYVRQVE